MRVGVVRDDMGRGLHLGDLLSRNQYPYASQVAGQSRVIRKPSDAEIASAISSYISLSPATLTATDTDAAVDTTTDDTLRVSVDGGATFTDIVVTAGGAIAKTVIRDDLNTEFASASLNLIADIVGTNQIRIRTTSPDLGPGTYVGIDTVGNGSTLSTAIGFAAGGVSDTIGSLTTLQAAIVAAVYPTATTIDVSSATIIAVDPAFAGLSSDDQAALVLAIADTIAPKLIETGYAQLSFVSGKMSKMKVAGFRPGGVRAGKPAGIAIAVVEDDGSTAYSYP